MIPIIQKDDPILRKVAIDVSLQDINKRYITNILKDMKQALKEQDDGVAIAAPQIGKSLRIFIVSGKVLSPKYPDLIDGEIVPPDLVCINPTIIKQSRTKKNMTEGCLSVRWLYGTISRFQKITIKAYDETGTMFTRGASGLLAQIFQHEYDHLEGKLFIDSAINIEEIPPQTIEHQ